MKNIYQRIYEGLSGASRAFLKTQREIKYHRSNPGGPSSGARQMDLAKQGMKQFDAIPTNNKRDGERKFGKRHGRSYGGKHRWIFPYKMPK